MSEHFAADVNIHLRDQDRALTDQAAELAGSDLSQFMLASALKEGRNFQLEQTTIRVDTQNVRQDRGVDGRDAH